MNTNESSLVDFYNFTGNDLIDSGILFLILFWVLIWKGKALWIAAKQNSVKWFVAILVFQTLGILDILYIFIFSKKKAGGISNGAIEQNRVADSSNERQ